MATTTIRGAQIAFSEQGAGEVVVMLHCTGSNGGQWRNLASALAGRFHSVAPDLYGYGGTDAWAGRESITLADEAALVESLIERFDAPVHLVGHSFGGAVALRIARQAPQRIRTLSLIEPVAFHLLRDGDAVDAIAWQEVEGVVGTLSLALLRGDYWGGCGHFVDYWSGQGAWASMPEAKRAAFAQKLGKVVLDFWTSMNDPTRVSDLEGCRVPTLVIRGGRSPHPVRRIARHIAASMHDARLAEIRSAGHMAPMTHADEVNRLVTQHIETGDRLSLAAHVKTASRRSLEFATA